MKGNIIDIDKNHCFIYYIFNINKEKKTANKYIINSDMFSKMILTPTNYKVNGLLINNNNNNDF